MSADPARRSLEDFALKGNHLSKMTGVSVGTHAVPDAFLLMHSGVGCKYKTAAQVGPHDWGSHPNKREAWTQVGELQLVKGSSERIAPFARAWYERRRPSLMLVVSAYFIELTGEDFSYAVDDAARSVPCDMALIGTAAPNGGFYEGYADVLLEIVKRTDWKRPVDRPNAAAILGYWFDRYEADHKGNLSQIRQLLKVAGLDLGPVFLSGTPYTELVEAGRCGHLLQLPYVGKRARKIRRATKRDPVTLDLPMGMAGTLRFARTVAEAVGADGRKVERILDAQRKATEAQLDLFRDHVRGLAVAVFADGPLAAGLVTILDELGVRTPIVGIRERWLGGKTGFLDVLDRNGVQLPADTLVLEEPSLHTSRKLLLDAIIDGRLDGVLGSAHETNLVRKPPELMARLEASRYWALEVGFPSDNHHVTLAAPLFGFAGTLTLAQRILDQKLFVV